MDITAETINKIQEMMPVKERVREIDGRLYTYGQFRELRPPVAECLTLATLDGFIKFVNSRELPDTMVVTIDSETVVSLRSKHVDEKWKNFEVFADACATRFISGYRFGNYYDAESFMIKLQTGFIKTAQRDDLIKVASSISGESESKLTDDGISQSTTVGRAIKTKVTIQNPVMLKPVRTFQEVDQVTSPFIFRIDEGMELALHEGDSGKWKLDAMKNIAKYLRDNLNSVEVYA